MARPRLDTDERRTETLAIRLTAAERIRVEQAAMAARMSTSAYARDQVLRGRVITQAKRGLDHTVFDELRRIGVNLNQLTRLAHVRGQLPGELGGVCARLDRLLADHLSGAAGAGVEEELPA